MVQGLGFKVSGLGLRAEGLEWEGCRVKGLRALG